MEKVIDNFKVVNRLIELLNEGFQEQQIARILKISNDQVEIYKKKYYYPISYKFELDRIHSKIDRKKYVSRKSIKKEYFKDLKKYYNFSITNHNRMVIQKTYNEVGSYKKTAEILNISYNCVSKTIRNNKKNPFSNKKFMKNFYKAIEGKQKKMDEIMGTKVFNDSQDLMIKISFTPPTPAKHIVIDSLNYGN